MRVGQPTDILATLAAALAVFSWWNSVAIRPRYRHNVGLLVVIALAALALERIMRQVWPTWPQWAHVVSVTLALVAALGASIAAFRILVVTGPLTHILSESLLIGLSTMGVIWGIGAWDTTLREIAPSLALGTFSIAALALLVRAPAVSPSLVIDQRFRATVYLALIGAAFISLAIMAGDLRASPPVLAEVLAAIGFGLLALAPLVRWARSGHSIDNSELLRAVPSIMVVLALLAVAARWLLGADVQVAGLLLALITVSMAGIYAMAQWESAELVTELKHSRMRLAALADNAADVILGLDSYGRVVAVNAATRRLLHRDEHDLIGRPVSVVAEPGQRGELAARVREVAGSTQPSARLELHLAAPATGTAELRLRSVPGGAVAVLSDVTDAVQLREKLQRLVQLDHMTSVLNRTFFLHELASWLHQENPLCAWYIDVDGFKDVNDRYGHLAGDTVLVEVARRIRATVTTQLREGQTLVARLGGDEFVIVAQDYSIAAARKFGQQLLVALREPLQIEHHQLRISASIGIASTTQPAAENISATELLHRADLAMFAAKSAGRSQVALWDRLLDERAKHKVDVTQQLRDALACDRLEVAYQPIVRLADHQVVAVEALVRLRIDDETGDGDHMVNPAELVAVAEDTGEIRQLGNRILRDATRQAAAWSAAGHALPVHVNMSVLQLSDPDCVSMVRQVLADAELPASRLVLEMTESQMLAEQTSANDTISRLRHDGVQWAIDDFGSGYSSLAYLRRMPLQTVKVDKTLVDGVGSDPRATTLMRAVIGAARGMGIRVVCEGIEEEAVARKLRDMGVWAGQGFAFHPAMSATDLHALLAGSPPPTADLPAGHQNPDTTIDLTASSEQITSGRYLT